MNGATGAALPRFAADESPASFAGGTPGASHLLDATMFWNPSGGVRRYVMAKHGWLARHAGWRHTVATPTPDLPPAPGSPEAPGPADAPAMLRIPSLPLPGSDGAYRLPWQRGAAAELMRSARPTLIESADPYRLAWSALDAARALRVPAVAFCHSNLPQMAALAAGSAFANLAERAARAYLVRLYRRFDLVLAPSRSMVAQLQGWGLRQVQQQPLGVDTALFRPRPRQPGWRRALGIPSEARLLVYAGRYAPEKNLPTLVEAVRALGPRYWLLAIGAGPVAPAGPRVVLLPTIRQPERLAGVLGEADLFVHAGAQETFGLSVLEAMACGLPVVARASAGTGELVDESLGQAVADGTVERYAEAIADVFERDAAALGQAARRRAAAHDWQRVLPGLLATYEGLVGRNDVAPLAA